MLLLLLCRNMAWTHTNHLIAMADMHAHFSRLHIRVPLTSLLTRPTQSRRVHNTFCTFHTNNGLMTFGYFAWRRVQILQFSLKLVFFVVPVLVVVMHNCAKNVNYFML